MADLVFRAGVILRETGQVHGHEVNPFQHVSEGEGLSLPVGWTEGRDEFDGWTLLGWVLAAVAIAQSGAPSWFDLMRRASGARS